MPGDEHKPVPLDQSIMRSEDIVRLLDQGVLNALNTSLRSDSIPTQGFRHFALFLRIKSASTPTTVQIIVEFLEPSSGRWTKYNTGLFAALFYEDQDTATEVDDVFVGDVAGRQMRIRIVGVGTTASATFTVSVAVDLYN